jgi:hypothetical protein
LAPRIKGRAKLEKIIRGIRLMLASSKEVDLIFEKRTGMTVPAFTKILSFDDCPFHCAKL